MKLKDIENRILTSIESGDKLDPHILDAAKREMENNRNVLSTDSEHSSSKKHFDAASKYALSACISIVLCLAVLLPIIFLQGPSAATETERQTSIYTSMQLYLDAHDIPVSTLEKVNLIEDSDSILGGISGTETVAFTRGDWFVVCAENRDIILEEVYATPFSDCLVMSVLLFDDQSVKDQYFSNHKGLDGSSEGVSTVEMKGVTVYYRYDTNSKNGYARFEKGGYNVYIRADADSAQAFAYNLTIIAYLQ